MTVRYEVLDNGRVIRLTRCQRCDADIMLRATRDNNRKYCARCRRPLVTRTKLV